MSWYGGPCYSNIDTIKRAMLTANRPLSIEQIVLYVQTNWAGGKGTDRETAQSMVKSALFAPSGQFTQLRENTWTYKQSALSTIESKIVDAAYQYMVRRKTPCSRRDMVQYLTRVTAHPKSLVEQNIRHIHTDVRFARIDDWFVLSRWQLLNDLVYQYLVEREVTETSVREVGETVRQAYDISNEDAVFAPEIDKRFKVERPGVLSIVSQKGIDPIEQRIVVPDELTREIDEQCPDIVNYIKSMGTTAVSTSRLLREFFEISRAHTSYLIYEMALHEKLQTVSDVEQTRPGEWSPVQRKDFQRQLKSIQTPRVIGSIPTLPENIKDLEMQTNSSRLDATTQREVPGIMESTVHRVTVNVLYRHRVHGELPMSSRLKLLLDLEHTSIRLRITAHTAEGFQYEWWYDPESKRLGGLLDFFADFEIEPGTTLWLLKREDKYDVDVRVMGTNELIATEQARYSDIDSLYEKAELAQKSFFSLICEVLIDHLHDGLHYTEIVQRVSQIRPAITSTIQSLLSQNKCFYQETPGNGVWFLNPSKIGRYYVNEEGKDTDGTHDRNVSVSQTSSLYDNRYADPDTAATSREATESLVLATVQSVLPIEDTSGLFAYNSVEGSSDVHSTSDSDGDDGVLKTDATVSYVPDQNTLGDVEFNQASPRVTSPEKTLGVGTEQSAAEMVPPLTVEETIVEVPDVLPKSNEMILEIHDEVATLSLELARTQAELAYITAEFKAKLAENELILQRVMQSLQAIQEKSSRNSFFRLFARR